MRCSDKGTPSTVLGSVLALNALVIAAPVAAGQATDAAGAPGIGAYAAAADAVAAQLDDHEFVFIGSTHGEVKIEEFLTCLVSRPAFIQRATDIVVEWASSAHQDLLDRHVLGLESLPEEELASIWFDTDAPTMWTTLPQVRTFLETLRGVNRELPAAKRIRLIGGNEGIDWSKVKAVEDLAPYPFKTNLLPHLLVEHLAKAPGNRTLVVYGDCHVHYHGNNFMGELEEALGRSKLFVVGRIDELAPDERPFLEATGDAESPFFATVDRVPANLDGPPSLSVCTGESSPRLADYMDAFVYLGPSPDRSTLGSIPLTGAQQHELARRAEIKSDAQRTMNARFAGRARWFEAHPDDFPPRPSLP